MGEHDAPGFSSRPARADAGGIVDVALRVFRTAEERRRSVGRPATIRLPK